MVVMACPPQPIKENDMTDTPESKGADYARNEIKGMRKYRSLTDAEMIRYGTGAVQGHYGHTGEQRASWQAYLDEGAPK